MSTNKRKDDKEQPANAEPKHRYMEWLKQQIELDRSEGIGVFQSLREQRERKERMRKEQPISTLFLYSAGAAQPDPTSHHFAAAKAVLIDAKETDNENPEYTSDEDVRRDLAAKLVDSEAALWKRAGTLDWQDKLDKAFGYKRDLVVEHQETTEDFPLTSETGEYRQEYDCTPDEAEAFFRDLAGANKTDVDMLPLTRHLVDHLEAIGAKGKYLAELIAEDARTAWKQDGGNIWELYSETLPPMPGVVELPILFRFYLARALWCDVVKPPLERRRTLIAPAITEATSDLIVQVSQPGVVWTPDGQALRPEGIEPRKIEGIVAQIEEVDVQSLKADTVHFWLSVLAETTYAFDRYVATGKVDNRIVLPGGWRELIDMVNKSLDWNLSTSSATQRGMKRAIQAQAYLEFKIGPKRGNLLAYTHNEDTNELRLTLGDMLLPLFGKSYDDSRKLSHSQRRWVNLVPVTKPASLQPFRPADHGKALSFQHVLIAYAREHREDILDGRGFDLNPMMLKGLAAKARMPRPEKAIDAWTIDGDDSPALLQKVSRYRYMIADNERFGPARQMIEQAAKKTRKACIRQQRKRLRDKESKYPKPEGDAP